jgi:hypothetical protein
MARLEWPERAFGAGGGADDRGRCGRELVVDVEVVGAG